MSKLLEKAYYTVRRPLVAIAWPNFKCENCNGMAERYGCECECHGAIRAGGPGPEHWRKVLRWLLMKV